MECEVIRKVAIKRETVPDLHPEAYGMGVDGECLLPEIKDNETVLVEPLNPEKGQVGAIKLKGNPKPVMKYVPFPLFCALPLHPRSEISPFVYVAQINPLKWYCLEGDKIESLHRVVGVIESEGIIRPIKPFDHYCSIKSEWEIASSHLFGDSYRS